VWLWPTFATHFDYNLLISNHRSVAPFSDCAGRSALADKGATLMNLPKIDISALPDLDVLTGVFGSATHHMASDDSIVILMVFIYELLMPQ